MAEGGPWLALSLTPDRDYRATVQPLFDRGAVDAVEWSFDLGWSSQGVPGWVAELLDRYAARGRLYGHGVAYSLLSATLEPRQERWLERLRADCARRSYAHVSEHLGFMTTPGFAFGPPLPVPFTPEAVAVGRDRLARLREACGCPVGLENLALALSARDVDDQGQLLEELLAPDGFLLLDLHNLWCQALNFERDPVSLLESYPLDRVRELHVSGGSWSHPGGRRFRRDTHDGPVPAEVLELVPRALERCPGAELVVLERINGTLADPADQERFRADFRALRELL